MKRVLVVLTVKERDEILSLMMDVHTYECPFWRIGKRYGPCNCGGKERHEVLVKKLRDAPSLTRGPL